MGLAREFLLEKGSPLQVVTQLLERIAKHVTAHRISLLQLFEAADRDRSKSLDEREFIQVQRGLVSVEWPAHYFSSWRNQVQASVVSHRKAQGTTYRFSGGFSLFDCVSGVFNVIT